MLDGVTARFLTTSAARPSTHTLEVTASVLELVTSGGQRGLWVGMEEGLGELARVWLGFGSS